MEKKQAYVFAYISNKTPISDVIFHSRRKTSFTDWTRLIALPMNLTFLYFQKSKINSAILILHYSSSKRNTLKYSHFWMIQFSQTSLVFEYEYSFVHCMEHIFINISVSSKEIYLRRWRSSVGSSIVTDAKRYRVRSWIG